MPRNGRKSESFEVPAHFLLGMHEEAPALDHFCNECKELVCYKCAHSPLHANHAVQYAEEVLSSRKEPLQTILTEVKARASAQKRKLDTLQEKIEKNRDETRDAIQARYKEIQARLEKTTNELLAEVTQSVQQRLEEVEKLRRLVSHTVCTMDQCQLTLNNTDATFLPKEQCFALELAAHQKNTQEVGNTLRSGGETKLGQLFRFERDVDEPVSAFGRAVEFQCDFDLTLSESVASSETGFSATHDTAHGSIHSRCIDEQNLVKPFQVIKTDQLVSEGIGPICPSGVCCTPTHNNVIISDVANRCLWVVDQNGRVLNTIHKGSVTGSFSEPVALSVHSDNSFYIVDQHSPRIRKFAVYGEVNLANRKAWRRLRRPQDIAVSHITGDVYIADSEKRRVFVYDSNGTYRLEIGGKRTKLLKFSCPVGVAITQDDRLLVLDRSSDGGHCVWCIVHQPELQLDAKIGEGILNNPSRIAVTHDGTVLVTEADSGSVCVFSPEGELIHRFGQAGKEPGMFNQPSGIFVSREGRVFVADKGNSRVQVFSIEDILRQR